MTTTPAPHRRLLPSIVAGAALLLGACSSSKTATTTVAPTTTVAATTTAPAATTSTAPTTTAEATTTSAAATTTAGAPTPTTATPTTTAPAPTTTGGPTTTAAPRSTWKDDTLPNGVESPCCESPFAGTPSPAFDAASQAPLPDGLYAAITAKPWDPAAPGQLVVAVQRIEACTVLGEAGCDNGPVFDPGQMGIATDPVRTVTLSLDASLPIGMMGWDDTTCQPMTKTGTGADLRALFEAFTADYQAAIGSQLAAGVDADTITTQLQKAPQHGFAAVSSDCAGAGVLVYTHADAPSLLLQTITRYVSDAEHPPLVATDLVRTQTIAFAAGKPSLYVYAGFYS